MKGIVWICVLQKRFQNAHMAMKETKPMIDLTKAGAIPQLSLAPCNILYI